MRPLCLDVINDVGVCGTPFVSGRVSSPESRLGPDERWDLVNLVNLDDQQWIASQIVDASPVTAVNITKKHLELAWKASFHHFPERS